MKKSLLLIVAVFCFCLLTAAAAFADNVVLIGIYEPASGDSGAGGKQEMLGVQYANYLTPTVEIGGETYDIQLIYADNGSSTDKAPSAAQSPVSRPVRSVLAARFTPSPASRVMVPSSPETE